MTNLSDMTEAELLSEYEKLDQERHSIRARGRVLKGELSRRSTEEAIASKLLYGSVLSSTQEAYWKSLDETGKQRIKQAASNRVAAAQKVLEARVENI